MADSDRRLKSKTNRKDFLTNIVDKVESGEVSKEELIAHSSTLMYVVTASVI